jgi:phosphomannomutase
MRALLDGEIPRAAGTELGGYRRTPAPSSATSSGSSRSPSSTSTDPRRRFRVALDCVRGAGGTIFPRLLEALGCEVEAINLETDGRFPREPEPVAENLGELEALVRAAAPSSASPPTPTWTGSPSSTRGPRDRRGLHARARRPLVLRHRPGAVVTNLSTSRLLDDVAESAGRRWCGRPVGEINVARRMQAEGATIGGEGNGGVILPDVHLTRDAPVAAALILQLLAEEGVR